MKSVFPESYQEVMTMAYYLASQGGALSLCSSWAKSHMPDLADSLSSQRISELPATVSTDQYTPSTVDGRLFVQFIALILVCALRKQMRNTRLIEQYTVREMLMEMETLTKVNYSGKYGHIMTGLTKHQR